MNRAEVLRDATARLRDAGVPGAARDAALLLREVAGDDDAATRLDAMLARRAAREPMSHILGRRAFWSHEFAVTPDVLDPRPETETLVEAALAAPFDRVLDLGTGSGCILLSLLAERPAATGLGTDISPAALAVAVRNAQAIGLTDRAGFRVSDWLDAVDGAFDLIVSNPPYIAEAEMPGLAPELAHEPRAALTPGGDGLDAYRAIARDAPAHLAPGGRLMVEIGAGQGAAVAELMRAGGLGDVAVLPDLDDRDRVVHGEIPRSAGIYGL